MEPFGRISSTVAKEAIAAGIGVGTAAAAAIFSSQRANGLESTKEDISEGHPSQLNSESNPIVEQIDGNVWCNEFIEGLPCCDMESVWNDSSNNRLNQVALDESNWVQQFDAFNLNERSIPANEFMTLMARKVKEQEESQDWATEFHFQINNSSESIQSHQTHFWESLENEWKSLAENDQNHQTYPWLMLSSSPIHQEYKFNQDNPFENLLDPLTEGKRRLVHGDIPNAVLAFESAVQKNPQDGESWLLLGKTQAQNEQDPMAIPALNQALKIQPNNLVALISLGASLTNEAYQLQAAQALKNWLKSNPKYSHLINSNPEQLLNKSRISSALSKDELESIQKSFIEAARLHPITGIDPDVQSALGILFNLGENYQKAADCFKAALTLQPNDALLWNRLGATLANGGNSEEAISAYRRALELSPGFIRTRYNLGVSCINLGSYREAAEHFLTALNQQANAKKANLMSESIWNSFRMILHLMDRGDLTSVVDSRDLQRLNKEFQLH